jgi:hypothetical protein
VEYVAAANSLPREFLFFLKTAAPTVHFQVLRKPGCNAPTATG